QILDASLITNVLIDSRRWSGRLGVIIKLDIEEAFNHINWLNLGGASYDLCL
ncbi:hypothetical protein LINPERPRIM_LOCUS11760, partial [Linum perenne]